MNRHEKHKASVDARKAEEQTMLLEHLRKLPIVSFACEKTGVSRPTYYRWRREDSDFGKAADEALTDGTALISDMAESQLLTQIREGNLGAVTYWLKHRNPAYSSRLEVTAKIAEKDPLSEEQQELIRQAIRLASLPNSPLSYGQQAPSPGTESD